MLSGLLSRAVTAVKTMTINPSHEPSTSLIQATMEMLAQAFQVVETGKSLIAHLIAT